MNALKDISRPVPFACEFLKRLKVLSELMKLAATLWDQIGQSPDEKITFGTEALHLALAGYSLISQDFKNMPDLLEHLPSQADLNNPVAAGFASDCLPTWV
jgi:hypothetical protein